ncbi:hypothetical protein quinque_009626 [Culex quinquefasciatus]
MLGRVHFERNQGVTSRISANPLEQVFVAPRGDDRLATGSGAGVYGGNGSLSQYQGGISRDRRDGNSYSSSRKEKRRHKIKIDSVRSPPALDSTAVALPAIQCCPRMSRNLPTCRMQPIRKMTCTPSCGACLVNIIGPSRKVSGIGPLVSKENNGGQLSGRYAKHCNISRHIFWARR